MPGKNGSRQPQASTSAGSRRRVTITPAIEPSKIPAIAEKEAQLPTNPRWARRALLNKENDRRRVLAANRCALDHAEQDQDQRRETADLRIGREQADGERRERHRADRGHQGGLAAIT